MSSIVAKTGKANLSSSNEVINDVGHIVTPSNMMPKRPKFIRNGTFKSTINGTEFIPATSGSSSSMLTVDGWFVKQYGGCTANMAVGVSAYTDVNSMNYAAISVSSVSGAQNFVIFEQREHDITKFAGRTLSLSFMARSATPATIAVELLSDYADGTPRNSRVVAVDLGVSWDRYDLRIPVPPIPGVSVGALSKLVTRFWLVSSGYEGVVGAINTAPNSFYFANIDDGSNIYEPSVQDEREAVGRYFEKVTYDMPIPNAGKTATSSDVFGRIYFETKKAVVPSASQISITGSANMASPTVSSVTRSGFNIIATATSSTSAARITGFTCNCELPE